MREWRLSRSPSARSKRNMSRVIRSSNRLRATSSPALAVAAILGVVSFVGAAMQMQMQKKGGSVVSITTSMVDHPLVGVTASVPMITKGGIESISKKLAMEYAKEGESYEHPCVLSHRAG